jgi:hypothetical protein
MEPGDNDPLAAGLLLARSWQATGARSPRAAQAERMRRHPNYIRAAYKASGT